MSADRFNLREVLLAPLDAAGVFGTAQRALLPRTHFCLVAYGSVGRVTAEELARVGALDFTLIDLKRYVGKSAGSQCSPEEVGMLKVEAGRRTLAGPAARVTVYPDDVFTVPDGVVRPNTVVIVSADNPRAAIGANRLAARMKARLLKVNIEPEYSLVAVRAYDFRGPYRICLECQLSAAQYARQEHPQSCDGTGQRPTGSPRILSQAAGKIGAIAALALLDESQAASWVAADMQFCLTSGEATWSRLATNAACQWAHACQWGTPDRIPCGPQEISLADLVRQAGHKPGASTHVRFCQQVALQSRCEACHAEDRTPRWFRQWEKPSGKCAKCGGHLRAVPFYVSREVPWQALTPVADQPLAAWGVQPGAVIELVDGEMRHASVIGTPRDIRPAQS